MGTWIQTEDVWGGALELSILSKCGGDLVEGVLRSTTSCCTASTLGRASRSATARVAAGSAFCYSTGCTTTRWSWRRHLTLPSRRGHHASRVRRRDGFAPVEALATSERAARNFTDTSSFALQCLVCGAGLKGNADAEQHAAQRAPEFCADGALETRGDLAAPPQ